MLRSVCIRTMACAALVSAGLCHATSLQAREAWLMRNYRFTGPPPPGSIEPLDPVVSELRQIQNMVLSIMRKADFWDNWEAALAAASQATANAQLIGVIEERLRAAAAPSPAEQAGPPTPAGPSYAIAFKNHTIELATAYWVDGPMLHYLTRQGSHVQVRLDLIDRDLSTRINHTQHLDFNLP